MAPGSSGFDPDPAQELFADGFDGAGGQGRPAQLAAGIGQGGLDGMKAIKPFGRRFRAGWRLAERRGPAFPRVFAAGLG